jgi:hypothetical protein
MSYSPRHTVVGLGLMIICILFNLVYSTYWSHLFLKLYQIVILMLGYGLELHFHDGHYFSSTCYHVLKMEFETNVLLFYYFHT